MGILVERRQLSEDDAFNVLRRISQHHNIKMRDLAQKIRSGRTDTAWSPAVQRVQERLRTKPGSREGAGARGRAAGETCMRQAFGRVPRPGLRGRE
jgi:hypothetical protein